MSRQNADPAIIHWNNIINILRDRDSQDLGQYLKEMSLTGLQDLKQAVNIDVAIDDETSMSLPQYCLELAQSISQNNPELDPLAILIDQKQKVDLLFDYGVNREKEEEVYGKYLDAIFIGINDSILDNNDLELKHIIRTLAEYDPETLKYLFSEAIMEENSSLSEDIIDTLIESDKEKVKQLFLVEAIEQNNFVAIEFTMRILKEKYPDILQEFIDDGVILMGSYEGVDEEIQYSLPEYSLYIHQQSTEKLEVGAELASKFLDPYDYTTPEKLDYLKYYAYLLNKLKTNGLPDPTKEEYDPHPEPSLPIEHEEGLTNSLPEFNNMIPEDAQKPIAKHIEYTKESEFSKADSGYTSPDTISTFQISKNSAFTPTRNPGEIDLTEPFADFDYDRDEYLGLMGEKPSSPELVKGSLAKSLGEPMDRSQSI